MEQNKNVMRIFDNVPIRDNAIHQPDPHMWVNGFEIQHLVFGIINDLDVNVSVQPVGRAGAAQGSLGSASTITAHSEGILPLNIQSYWAPYISVTVQAASTPSSGRITIYAIWQ